ncbi:hypothetical protein SHEWT2_01197 [Shewanella hafniensis]|nr:hypothetical protein SHEWT2_01197 [Shewanella hafniensis]
MQFKREHRYLVTKIKDMEAALDHEELREFANLHEKIEGYRITHGKPPLECVVVEHDWANYEKTWADIEQLELSKNIKIFAMNECDWWIGESLEECIADYINYTGDPEGASEPEELTEASLERHTYLDVNEFDEDGRYIERTFKEQLAIEVAKGGNFPRFFASTEY